MSNYIGLNVGGKIYRTSRTTLTSTPGSFFNLILNGGIPSAQDEQGNYLIDRDGDIFRHILNYLRSNILVLPEGFNELQLLACEADFFQLDTLKEAVLGVVYQIIGLNVGGKIYQTTRETLLRAPQGYLAAIVSEKGLNMDRDKDGNFFIDRDGKLFRYILNFLREGALILPTTWNEFNFNLLMNEATFFRIPEIGEHVKSLKNFDENRKAAVGPSPLPGDKGYKPTSLFHLYYWHGRFLTYHTSHNRSRLEDLFSFKMKSRKYIESTFGVHMLSFTLDESLTKALVWFYQNKQEHGGPKILDYPKSEQDIIDMLKIAKYSIIRSINFAEESTKYEF